MDNRTQSSAGGIREVIQIAFPMMVSHACETVMTFTDRMFLSRLGSEQMNAVMAGGVSVIMIMAFFLGLINYTTALVAQYLGLGRKDSCSKVLNQALIISLLAYPLILTIGRFLGHGLFTLSELSPIQESAQRIYFDIFIYATLISLFRASFSGFFSGVGRTRIVMCSALLAMGVNIVANYALILGHFGLPAMGIRGAAIGTIIGTLSGLLLMAFTYYQKRNKREYSVGENWGYDREIMGKLFRYGSPGGFEMFLNLFAFTSLVFVFHSQGSIAATAATILFNWDMVAFVPLLGMEVGVISLVGRYMGAGAPSIARRSAISGMALGLIFATIMAPLFILIPSAFVDIFKPENLDPLFLQARPMAINLVRLTAFYLMAVSVMMACIGTLRGSGDTLWPMGVSILLHWSMIPLAHILLNKFHCSMEWTWGAIILLFLGFCGLILWRFLKGEWQSLRIVEPINMIPDVFHEPADI